MIWINAERVLSVSMTFLPWYRTQEMVDRDFLILMLVQDYFAMGLECQGEAQELGEPCPF